MIFNCTENFILFFQDVHYSDTAMELLFERDFDEYGHVSEADNLDFNKFDMIIHRNYLHLKMQN